MSYCMNAFYFRITKEMLWCICIGKTGITLSALLPSKKTCLPGVHGFPYRVRKENAEGMPPCLLTYGLTPGPQWTPVPPPVSMSPLWKVAPWWPDRVPLPKVSGPSGTQQCFCLLLASGAECLPSKLGTCGRALSGAKLSGTTSFNNRLQSWASGPTS